MEMRIFSAGNAKVNADCRGFEILSDQPTPSGEDTAPAPFELFLASLGTCAGIYLYRFLQMRKMSTDNVEILLTTEDNPKKGMLDVIQMRVVLPEDFPIKYKKAVLNSINLCAVKKHIHEPPIFRTIVQVGSDVIDTSET